MLKLFINFSKMDSSIHGGKRESEDNLLKSKISKQSSDFSGRNRRLYDRYDLSRSLTTMYGLSEYCFVCDLSENGMSAILSENFSNLLSLQKILDARLKIRNVLIDIRLQVIWKSQSVVGFSFLELSEESRLRLLKIMRPLKIASSIKKFESHAIFNSRSLNHDETRIEWYHGEESCELYLWKNEIDELEAFQLSVGDLGIRWSKSDGLKTGSVSTVDERGRILNPNEILWFTVDRNEIHFKKEFCLDLIASLPLPLGSLLESSMQINARDDEPGNEVRYGA